LIFLDGFEITHLILYSTNRLALCSISYLIGEGATLLYLVS